MFPTIQVLIEMSVHVNQAKAAMTQSARDKKEKEIGARYSELISILYVATMHNLFLGTARDCSRYGRNMVS